MQLTEKQQKHRESKIFNLKIFQNRQKKEAAPRIEKLLSQKILSERLEQN